MGWAERKRAYDYWDTAPADAEPASAVSGNQAVLLRPSSKVEMEAVADHLRQGHMVLINLEASRSTRGKRLLDFAAGIVYALNSQFYRVAPYVYLLLPDTAAYFDESADLDES